MGEKVKLITRNSVKVMNLVCDEMREKGTRTTEREILLLLVSGKAVICLIQTGGAPLHHSLGRSCKHMCVLCVPGDSHLAVCKRRWRMGGEGFGRDRWQGDIEEMARGSKNVLDCRLSGIKLVAAFLYCGYRNQTKSSPDKMSMTSPPQTKPRLSTILSAGHFFK